MAIPLNTESRAMQLAEFGPAGAFRFAGTPTTEFDGVANVGALCIDTTGKKLLVNTGTKASNTWTVAGTQT